MMNVSSLTTKNNIESPKTPGGISKSLLTPCRRIGLSRNWRKSGPSPFISPLTNANNTAESIKQEPETRKRKKRSPEKEIDKSNDKDANNIDLSNTPNRTILQKKRSKTLQLSEQNVDDVIPSNGEESETLEKQNSITKLSRKSSKSKNQNKAPDIIYEKDLDRKDIVSDKTENSFSKVDKIETSPNNLTKECISVIQNKMKAALSNKNNKTKLKVAKSFTSEVLLDLDSDDVPLCELNQNRFKETEDASIANETKDEVFVKKLHDKKTSTGDLEYASRNKCKHSTKKSKNTDLEINKPISQASSLFDDNDDDEFDTKKTILIKKTYNKLTRPTKAKSTGSITDQDIQDIKVRIESKMQLLLSKSLTPETEELRGLIKRWQKGCQEALMDLMNLMKKRMSEPNMGNLEILQMLKIPPNLVGYDLDNDCFNTPSDRSVVLNSLNII